MPHQILQCLRIHPGLCHVGTVGVAAYMRSDVWHLHPVNLIVPCYHMVESMFPMHGYKRHSLIVKEQESAVTIDHLLNFRSWSVLDDGSEHILTANTAVSFSYPQGGGVLNYKRIN